LVPDQKEWVYFKGRWGDEVEETMGPPSNLNLVRIKGIPISSSTHYIITKSDFSSWFTQNEIKLYKIYFDKHYLSLIFVVHKRNKK